MLKYVDSVLRVNLFVRQIVVILCNCVAKSVRIALKHVQHMRRMIACSNVHLLVQNVVSVAHRPCKWNKNVLSAVGIIDTYKPKLIKNGKLLNSPYLVRKNEIMYLHKNRQTFGWSTDVQYNVGDLVYYRDVLYVCIQNHVSSLEDRPIIATRLWQLYT